MCIFTILDKEALEADYDTNKVSACFIDSSNMQDGFMFDIVMTFDNIKLDNRGAYENALVFIKD